MDSWTLVYGIELSSVIIFKLLGLLSNTHELECFHIIYKMLLSSPSFSIFHVPLSSISQLPFPKYRFDTEEPNFRSNDTLNYYNTILKCMEILFPARNGSQKRSPVKIEKYNIYLQYVFFFSSATSSDLSLLFLFPISTKTR